jgi:predicted DNA-binding transcriptional regulator YafY
MQGDPFEVEVEFHGKPAEYISERTWSEDQEIVDISDGEVKIVRLTFTSSSKLEVVPWVLSFGESARVIRPPWLVDEIRSILKKALGWYDLE